jgi:hypothetical protein
VSLAIDVDKVVGVLLADGWHGVQDASFTLGSYEYIWHDDPDDPRHRELVHGATGFRFLEHLPDTIHRYVVSGPLTAILAVRHVEVRSPE